MTNCYVSNKENKMYSAINPLVPDAHYSERPDKQVSLQIKVIEDTLIEVKLWIFIFCTLGTNELI